MGKSKSTGDLPLVVLGLTTLIAIARREDPWHALALDVMGQIKSRCEFAVSPSTLNSAEEQLRETRIAIRHLETLPLETFGAAYQQYCSTAFVHHFIKWYRSSYDAFVFDVFQSLSRVIQEFGVTVLDKAKDSTIASKLYEAYCRELPGVSPNRAQYVAQLFAVADDSAKKRRGITTVWSLHPDVTGYGMITRRCGISTVSAGVAGLVPAAGLTHMAVPDP